MQKTLSRSAAKAAGSALVLSLGLALSACGGMATNRSLYSEHQPVVERVNYVLDVDTSGGNLSYSEQQRLAGWFEAMDLRYGDRIAIVDPTGSSATRSAVETLAGRYGLMVNDEAPPAAGYANVGAARVVITRAKASVPGCPDWSSNSDTNFGNATSSNYGCAVNGNLAAMVANPEHLIKGAEEDSDTVVMSSTKAIDTYRKATPTGGGGTTVKQTSSTSGN